MKAIKIIVIGFIFLQLCVFSLFSQQEVNVSSPQVADFMRLTSGSVAKNTGRLNFGLSFFALSTPSFSMPVGISYNSAGFMPLKNPGIVGMDWALNVGGVITREVRGIPDDRNEIVLGYPIHGMLYLARNDFSEAFPSDYSLESRVMEQGWPIEVYSKVNNLRNMK